MNQVKEQTEKAEINGTDLILGNRYLLLEDKLILADLHLGKTTHFRKAGLPVPAHAREADQQNLIRAIEVEKPKSVIVLGDLFHSVSNAECEELAMITSQFAEVNFILVMGNHDILKPEVYRSLDFETCDEMAIGNFILTHEPMENVPDKMINMHGHIHPGVRLIGKGRQSMSFPCFHLSEKHFCLPSFGALTGLAISRPNKRDRVWAVINEAVHELN